MSEIPTASPQPPMDPSYAANKVKGPAIGLIVTGAIGILWALWSLVSNLVQMGADPAEVQREFEQIEGLEGFNPAQFVQAVGAIGIVLSILALVVCAVVILGGVKLMKLQQQGLVVAAAILAMIPCISPCCILGIPFGVWTLVVLQDPAVKAAFR